MTARVTPSMAALVPPEIGRVRFDAGKTIWLWGMAIPGVAGIAFATSTTLAVSLVLTFLTLCVGHSVGLHRGIIHRTYQARARGAAPGPRRRGVAPCRRAAGDRPHASAHRRMTLPASVTAAGAAGAAPQRTVRYCDDRTEVDTIDAVRAIASGITR